jgi:hypothetical protein
MFAHSNETGASAIVRWLGIHRGFFHRTVACFREEHATFRPRENMLSVAGQILHSAVGLEVMLGTYLQSLPRFAGRRWVSPRGEAEGWAGSDKGLDDLGWTNASDGEPVKDEAVATSLEKSLAVLDATFELFIQLFSEIPEAELNAPLVSKLYPPGANGWFVIEGAMDHTAHHRGALAQYARLLGLSPKLPYFDIEEFAHEAMLERSAA